MPTYLPLTESEYLGLGESEYLGLEEGDSGVTVGYFDTFSLLFGWWSAEPVAYSYITLGNFYICRSNTNTYHIHRSHSKTYYVGLTGSIS